MNFSLDENPEVYLFGRVGSFSDLTEFSGKEMRLFGVEASFSRDDDKVASDG